VRSGRREQLVSPATPFLRLILRQYRTKHLCWFRSSSPGIMATPSRHECVAFVNLHGTGILAIPRLTLALLTLPDERQCKLACRAIPSQRAAR
jgi:hypothetical protein